MMDLYWSFLNCGFRLPVSAGSASGVMPSWPGYERVYVHMDGPFSYDQWFRNLKAGQSVATNGPLLIARVNGKLPGAEIAWVKPTNVKLTIEAHSQNPLERVEVIYSGKVLRAFRGMDTGEFQKTIDLTVTQAGWLAVRCFEPVTSTIRYAHTSPFYFTQRGKLPVDKAAALKWARYIHQLARTVDASDYPSREHYNKAQATFRKAEEIYQGLADNP
jgi:hypothetical protein